MKLVRCPACQTTFRARPEHLAARAGRVRCGHCYTPFDALENLIDTPPAEEIVETAPSHDKLQSKAAFDAHQPIADDADDISRELVTPPPSEAADDAGDLDKRLALALSPSSDIGSRLDDDDRIQQYHEDHDLHEALTEPPDLAPDATRKSEPAESGAPPRRNPDIGEALRWSPVRNPGVGSPASLSTAVWPALVAQPPEPETIQPEVFPARDSDVEALADDKQTTNRSSQTPPFEPEPNTQSRAPITTDPDDRPWRRVTQERREPAFAPRAATALETNDEYNPDLARYARRGEPKGRVWLWALMVGVLLGSLAVQSAYVFRVELARQWPQLRPAFLELCTRLGCDMPLPRNAQAINVTASNLESDPNAPTNFVLHARLRNEAGYLQAHPYLELTLTDARDRPVARRVLEPREWLSSDAVEAGFGGRTEVEVRLPFGAPELTNATGYRLYAFYP